MKKLINFSGVIALFFMIVNCSPSKTVATDSMGSSQPVSAGKEIQPVEQHGEPKTTETPVFSSQEVPVKRTPSFVTPNKQAE